MTDQDDLDECWCCGGLHDSFKSLCPACDDAGCTHFGGECQSDHKPVMPDGGRAQDSTRTTRDDLRTDSRRNFVYDAVKQALNGDAKIGTYDDPEWIEAVADHAAYLSMKVDDIEEFSVREARLEIDELINEWELDVVTNDFWTERKVTINE